VFFVSKGIFLKKESEKVYSIRIRELREKLGLNIAEFVRQLNIPRSTLVGWEDGKTVSIEILKPLESKFKVNIDWLLTGTGEMFLSPKQEKDPLIADLDAFVDRKLEKIESRMAKLEDHLKATGLYSAEMPDYGLYALEPEPEYAEEKEKTAFVDDIAAGPPIQQSEDLSQFINVPKRFIKTKPEDYYAARIRGESMTAAGIPDGCKVLIRRSDVPRDGAIQVVRCGGRSTLKRMREGEDHTWTLHFEDNSERFITIGKGEEYQVQGDFVAVLPEDK
jgi:SOS-response transcriptional repressor LexA